MFNVPEKSVVMLSGSIDSSFLAYALRPSKNLLRGVTINYGQHSWLNSLRMINRLSLALNLPVEQMNIPQLGNSFAGFMDPEYDRDMVIMCEYEEMGAFISIVALAASWTAAIGYDALIVGYNKDDRELDPERYAHTKDAHDLVAKAISVQRGSQFQILMPLWEIEKAEIVKMSVKSVGLPLDSTWSCWRSGPYHCGQCPGCSDRIETFKALEMPDPVEFRAN